MLLKWVQLYPLAAPAIFIDANFSPSMQNNKGELRNQ